MVIDSSAHVAILRTEPERDSMLTAIAADPTRMVSAFTLVEAGIVLEGRYGASAGANLELFVFDAGIEAVPFDSKHAAAALRAWRKFGKGRHRAGLNLGDCCTHGLAMACGEPILAKGDDFPQTDVQLVALA